MRILAGQPAGLPLTADRRAPPRENATRRPDERWRDAAIITVALWSFVLLIYLPAILQRHNADPASVAIDSGTILVAMLISAPLFLIFRASRRLSLPSRVALLAAAVFGAALAQSSLDLFSTHHIMPHPERSRASVPGGMPHSYSAFLTYVCVFEVNLAFFQLAAAARRGRRQDRRLAQLAAAGHLAEIDALRHKLSPHFLFNTLNSLSALVVTNRNAEAEEVIDRLAIVLREALATDPGRAVTLGEEMALAEHFARIEEVRFADRLMIRLFCSDEVVAAPIPALTVQPLIELALRDAQASATGPVRLRIHARKRGGHLVIDLLCRFRRLADLDQSEVRAIESMRRRLMLLYPETAGLDVSNGARGFGATIRLPLQPAANGTGDLA